MTLVICSDRRQCNILRSALTRVCSKGMDQLESFFEREASYLRLDSQYKLKSIWTLSFLSS